MRARRGFLMTMVAAAMGCGPAHAVRPPAEPGRYGAVAIDPSAAGAEALVDAVHATFDSPWFRADLANEEDLHVNGNGRAISGSDTLAALLADTAPVRVMRAAADIPYERAATRLDARGATIELAPGVLADWASRDPARQACAVNAVAHAFAHAVVAPGTTKARFADNVSTFVRGPGHRIATFAVGAIAQCAYLVNRGATPVSAFAACLAAAGSRESPCVRPPPG